MIYLKQAERNLMKRAYITGNDIVDAVFFTGIEIEDTPHRGKPVLFVVGDQSFESIVSRANDHLINVVYIGANHSFTKSDNTVATVKALLDHGIEVTYDFTVSDAEWVKDQFADYISHPSLTFMASVKFPYADSFLSNTVLKIDDTDFQATNSAVWTIPLRGVTNLALRTDWNEYGESDTTIR